MPITLSESILNANKNGRLGLTIYSIPGYPDPDSYLRILEYLDALEEVSVIENTFPVSSSFSKYANSTIQNAHKIASKHLKFDDVTNSMLKASKPTLCVLYRHTVEQINLDTILAKHRNAIDGFLLEWEPEHALDQYATTADAYDVEFVHEIEPQMTPEEIDGTLALIQKSGHIYFVTAPMTGAILFEDDSIKDCAYYVKNRRSDVTLSAGFGVKTADDVARIAQIGQINGVIIGTAAIAAMAGGFAQLQDYLEGILPALKLTGGT